APNVTGSAALLVDYYDELFPGQVMRASTLKGLLIHTADDVGNAGPDYSYGWGLVDTEAAANHIKRNSESPGSSPLLESTLVDSTLHSLFFTWDGVGPIRATICWTDPAAANGSGLDDPTLKLINDLDLRVYGPGGSPTYSPYVLDPANPATLATTGDNFRDNVEQVYIASPGTPGTYELVVTHKSTLSGGTQIYSLILDGAASSLNVTPATGLSTSGTQGAIGEVNQAYTLTNTSGTSIDWTATISEAWATLSKTSGTLGIGANDSVTVTIKSMRANQLGPGSYSDTLVITNTGSGETASRQIALTVDTLINMVYSFPMDSDPGWTTEGEWAFGVPQGLGSFGGDPFSGHTGSNVYGYNLAGDYVDFLAEQNLTTTALDFSGVSGVTLTFWRWLGIEDSLYDQASVKVSADGSSWTTIWSHTGGSFNDLAWVQQSFDISAVADGESTVFVRWVMGTTDISITYPGWNIDDVTFDASVSSPSVVWVDFADVGSTQDGTENEPFIDLLPAVIALVTDGSGVVKIKGDTDVSDTDMTGVLLKPMTVQAIGGAVKIGVP
ncbi:MAG: S8 family serine peptidase, partial [Anaerolineales bacterium]|nr:S8 family serine peptidase [Anaerolineales bacterium]